MSVSEVKVLRESRESSVSNVKMCEVVKRVRLEAVMCYVLKCAETESVLGW